MTDQAKNGGWNAIVDDPRAAKTGCFSFIGVAVVGLGLLLSTCSGNPDADQQLAAKPSGPNEIDIVSECDLAVKSQLVSQSSYDGGRWTFTVAGNKATVVRKFESTNAFGAAISSTYQCEWDDTAKRITSLTVDSMGESKVIR